MEFREVVIAFAQPVSRLAMPNMRWNMSIMVHTFVTVVKKEKNSANLYRVSFANFLFNLI